MSEEFLKNKTFLKRLGLALGLLLLSATLGSLLGRWTAPQIVPKQLLIAEREAQEMEEEGGDSAQTPENEGSGTYDEGGEATEETGATPKATKPLAPPPLVDVPVYYHAGVDSAEQWPQVADSMKMAKDAGVRRFIFPVHFTWDEANAPLPIAPFLAKLSELDKDSKFILQLDLNPTAEWLQAHPEDVVQYNGEVARYPTPSSPIWRLMVEKGLAALVKEVTGAGYGARWEGVILSAMDEGLWRFANQFDRSEINSRSFLDWLVGKYENIEFLEAKWQITIGEINAISIPPEPESSNTLQVFLPLPNAHRQVDYLRYSSEIVAATIEKFARHFKGLTQSRVKVFAPYGYNLELTYNAAGHYAQEGLLDGPLDGIVGPVSYANRGLGGTGGMIGPMHSARSREKLWLVIDDTRTGLQRDAHTGEVTRMEGLREKDVYHLQERNFAMAMLNGMGLVWSDPRAEGRFVDEKQWGVFHTMHQEYQRFWASAKDKGLPPASQPGVVVVVDDESRFYQQCDVLLNDRLLVQARDAILMSGVNAQFSLLDDVLYSMAPVAPVYVFLNAFVISSEKRELLHAQLARNSASAIWMYAPGFIDTTGRTENISALVGMEVKAFEVGGTAGSMYRIAGPWLGQDEPIGDSMKWGPLFYIEDDAADTLATYQGNNKTSIAMRQQETGWTSVYIADPYLGTDLFREILRILEQPVYFRPGNEETNTTLYAHPDYIAVHAAKPGEKAIDFGEQLDVEDVFDAEAGWQKKRSITLPMKTGETRVLRLKR